MCNQECRRRCEATEPRSGSSCQPPPTVDKYGMCTVCGHRFKVSCTCGMTFAQKAKSVSIDAQALRIFHGN